MYPISIEIGCDYNIFETDESIWKGVILVGEIFSRSWAFRLVSEILRSEGFDRH